MSRNALTRPASRRLPDLRLTALCLAAGLAFGSAEGAWSQTLPAPGNPPNAGHASERRIALIIGNGDYGALSDLPNAPRDALLVEDFFQSVGYETVLLQNAPLADLSDAISDVAARTDEQTLLVFSFAGHGLQVGAGNFLLPTDSHIDAAA
ncbi:MAG: caspase family protein [Pseudomonadota bacterium]